jgi:hypothetical protein
MIYPSQWRAHWRVKTKVSLWCAFGGTLGLLCVLALHFFLLSQGPLVPYEYLGGPISTFLLMGFIIACVSGAGLFAGSNQWDLFAHLSVGSAIGAFLAVVLQTATSRTRQQHIQLVLDDPLFDFYPAISMVGLSVLIAVFCVGISSLGRFESSAGMKQPP